jgi:hypothetical protein
MHERASLDSTSANYKATAQEQKQNTKSNTNFSFQLCPCLSLLPHMPQFSHGVTSLTEPQPEGHWQMIYQPR